MPLNRSANRNLDALTELVLSGQCIAFLGAGVSCTDYPDWNNLVDILCRKCRLREKLPREHEEASLRKRAQLARVCSPAVYEETLRDLMEPKAQLLERYCLLAQLPFQSYLTTNHERSVLLAMESHHDSVRWSSYPQDLRAIHGRQEVFFLHGSIDGACNDPLEIVLTEDEFLAAYKGSCLNSFLVQTLRFNNVCFMGCSLGDEYLQEILRLCRACKDESRTRGTNVESRLYVLLDDQAAVPPNIEECGLEVVRYSRKNESHDGLTELFEEWVEAGSVEMRSALEDVPDLYQRRAEGPQ